MSDVYGPDWEIYIIIKPPWTIITALKCAIKHWIAAISESFQQRQSIFILKELLKSFEDLPGIIRLFFYINKLYVCKINQ